MHTVSAELKARVSAKIAECIEKSGVALDMPTVVYNINSARIGGTANRATNTIAINPVYLNAHTEKYISTTTVHEACHLIAFKKYGNYISAHGKEWKHEMRMQGAEPNRCHEYKVPVGVKLGNSRPRYDTVCVKCGAITQATKSVLNRIAAGGHYTHRSCGGRIAVGNSPTELVVRSTPKVTTPKAPAGTQSKLAKCFAIFKTYKHTYDRATMIYTFIQEAGCTNAGAVTYYSTCKNLDK